MFPVQARWVALLGCAALTSFAAPCFASSDDEAAAAALFDRALNDMMAGRFDRACPAFAESFRLDPRAGSLFTLAECEAKAGRVATASVHYEEYLKRFDALSEREQERQRERHEIAARQVEALKPQIARLTVALPPGAPSSLVVHRDGSVLGRAAIGVELPVDPGEHVMVIEFPGGAPRETRVTLAAGQAQRVVLPLPPAPPPPRVTRNPPPPARGLPTMTWVAGGVGLAGVAVGAVFGGITLGKKSTIDAHCTNHVCDPEGKSAADAASTTGVVSTVGFIVGGVGFATAAVFALTAPRAPKADTAFVPRIDVGPQGGSFALEHAW